MQLPLSRQPSFAIVGTFAKIRGLSGVVSQLSKSREKARQKAPAQKCGEIPVEIDTL
ncbi:MAG: hypothetical protein LBI62_08525 [Candidatus Accumulibacter sp.]|jgi:hypothetical protein|nr:hypothetical protein [Accumulibacter sp.]